MKSQHAPLSRFSSWLNGESIELSDHGARRQLRQDIQIPPPMFRCHIRFGLSPARQICNRLNRLIEQMRTLQQTLICIRQPYLLFSSQLIFNSMKLTPGS